MCHSVSVSMSFLGIFLSFLVGVFSVWIIIVLLVSVSQTLIGLDYITPDTRFQIPPLFPWSGNFAKISTKQYLKIRFFFHRDFWVRKTFLDTSPHLFFLKKCRQGGRVSGVILSGNKDATITSYKNYKRSCIKQS